MTEARPLNRLPTALRRGLVPLLLAAAVVAAGLAYRRWTDPDRIRRVVLERFGQRSDLGLRIGSAAFSLLDGITLHDVSIEGGRARGDAAAERIPPAVRFACPKVQIRLDRWSAIWGPLAIDSITASAPSVDLVLDASPDARSAAATAAEWAAFLADTADWPAVMDLSDARLRLSRGAPVGQRVVDELVATVRAKQSKANPQVYDLVWSLSNEPTALTGRMQLDLNPLVVRGIHGGLPPITIQALMLLGEQRFAGAAAWSDRLALCGTVRARRYELGGPAGMGSVELELRDISLSIPVSEQEIPLGPDERYLQFQGLAGWLRADAGGVSAELDGRFQGSECSVRLNSNAPVDDLDSLEDLALDMQLTVRDLYVPANDAGASAEQRRFIDRWPGLARWFREFEPNGTADIELGATLLGGTAPELTFDRIRIAATDADVLWRHVAYPLTDVEGTVLVERDGPVSVTLRGRRKDADVGVAIDVARPQRCAAAAVRIDGTGVPVDDALLSAVPEAYRNVVASWRPAGTTDLSIMVKRPACEGSSPARWRPEITASLRDVSAKCDAIPVALTGLTGTVRFADDRVEFRQIEGTAVGGLFRADGTMTFAHGEPADVRLSLSATDLRFGRVPPAALPPGLRRFALTARPTGPFDLRTELTRDSASGRIVQTSEVTLKDVALRLEDGAPVVTGVSGNMVATERAVHLDGITFRVGDGTVRADGIVEWDADGTTLDLDLATGNLTLDREVTRLLPAAVRDALDRWRVVGAVDVHLRAERRAGAGAGWQWQRAVVKLRDATMAHAFSLVPLTDVTAELTWDGEGVQVPRFKGRYNDAEVEGSLAVTMDADVASARFDVRGLILESSLRAALPPRFRSLWDRLAPRGTVDLRSVTARCHNMALLAGGGAPSAPVPPTCSIDGALVLHDVGVGQGRELANINGTIAGSGSLLDANGGVTLAGTLSLESVEAWHRKLHDGEGDWTFFQTLGGVGSAALNSFQADLYGGAVAGRMEVTFEADRAAYGLQTTWQGVDLSRFIAADPQAQAHGAAGAEVRGSIDAQAYVTGVIGDVTERRGGGRIELRDGHLYRLPLILAVLHVLNLSSPENDVFEDAATSFFLSGRQVRLFEIALRNDSFALVGSGTMSLPDRGVDLKLINAPTHMLAQLPILTDLLQGASRELMELHVTGPLYRPTVRARPLRALTDEIRELFQRRRPTTVVPGSS